MKSIAAMGIALCSLLASSCSSTPAPVGGAPGLEVIEGEMPAPTDADMEGVPTDTRVRIGDRLKVDVFGVPDLSNREVAVDENGRISFPLIGTVEVAGLQPEEVSERIEQRLRGDFVRDPQVSTLVTQTTEREVTVYGSVQMPGVYPVARKSSLMTTIAKARGLGQFANSRDVVVFRTVSGQRMATLYNLEAISRGMYDDPAIYPNDVIVVGESNSRRLFDNIVSAATLVATPLTILLQNTL
ncbi:polysaccharide biosynthesis/export family protein [Pseudoblastomonas halimionae]|uniref:Polysaccharide export protein n=1 Tax=Alteriqipengyuania halimionae TaxID=1926630 RepID=A0A6I4U4H1_9SPHN|nr:polysaccharide biosynthesis/export family protein [Alteriqipengyuania halimionae]MXP10900.1 polysaccharide export protein [Alteriqipengyuania halimionae]